MAGVPVVFGRCSSGEEGNGSSENGIEKHD